VDRRLAAREKIEDFYQELKFKNVNCTIKIVLNVFKYTEKHICSVHQDNISLLVYKYRLSSVV